MAAKTGVSERQARSDLSTLKRLQDLPDVDGALRSGGLSFAKAAVVARGADGDVSVARELLEVARTGSVEEIQRKVQEINAQRRNRPGDQERRRRSQYAHIYADARSMVHVNLSLVPELGAPYMEAARRAKGNTSWEYAEAFAKELTKLGGSNNKRSHVTFHVDLTHDGDELGLGERCEMQGVGPVSWQALLDTLKDASRSLVGTINNKLAWWSEQDRRSTTKDLPPWLLRAVKGKAYGWCEIDGCTNPADHVDHIRARYNDGNNDPATNLQAICIPCHNAKTKRDVPWAASVFYGKKGAREGPVKVVDVDTGQVIGYEPEFKDTG
jgi:hypothetical protein